nr:hypothetical protein CFP56_78451 [Quercus suber]
MGHELSEFTVSTSVHRYTFPTQSHLRSSGSTRRNLSGGDQLPLTQRPGTLSCTEPAKGTLLSGLPQAKELSICLAMAGVVCTAFAAGVHDRADARLWCRIEIISIGVMSRRRQSQQPWHLEIEDMNRIIRMCFARRMVTTLSQAHPPCCCYCSVQSWCSHMVYT